jgi:hypothetical protein
MIINLSDPRSRGQNASPLLKISSTQCSSQRIRNPLIRFVLVLAFLALRASLQAQDWELSTNDGAITIEYYYSDTNTVVDIPATINGLPVVAITANAFSSDAMVTSISIPSTLTNIATGAFEYCTSLSSLTVAAQNPVYSSLNGVLFNTNRTILLDYPPALAGNYTIPGTVTVVGTNAFLDCGGLTGVTLPDGVRNIEDYAFNSCTGLASLTLPNSVTNLGLSAFGLCTHLGSFTFGNGITSVGPFVFGGAGLTSITFPDGITNIGQYAYFNCTSLTNLVIGNAVTTIGEGAFSNCTKLTNAVVPASVISIGQQAFYNCLNLLSVTVAGQNPSYSSTNGVLFNKNQSTLVVYPAGLTGNYTTPNTVTSVGNFSFSSSSLTNVVFGDSVTSIGTNAFDAAFGVTSVDIGDGVTNLEEGSFYQCYNLASVSIGNRVAMIGDYAFYDCYSLTNITIPAGVNDIESYAFYNCSGLTNVTLSDGLTSIGAGVFSSCTRLASIIIPDKVISIGEGAFGYSDLQSVYFTGNAPSGDSTVYEGDSDVTNYYLPGTSGWTTNFANFPTVPWVLPNPIVLNNGTGFGVRTNGFGFTVSWATNLTVVVEACTNLAKPAWQPLQTNTLALTNGSFYFSDPQWKNHPQRFYRIDGT